MGFPERWGNTTPDHGIDPRVINPDPQAFRDALLALPTLAITADLDDLFGPEGIYTHSDRRGVAWERPISLEYIDPLGEDWQINCGLRIQGGAFRSHGLTRKHSLRVLFKAIYGPTRLPHPFFHPDPSHPDAPTTFNGFTLRANSNDGWQWRHAGAQPLYIRDSFGRETHRAMGGISPRERWTHLYINGAYWGLYNPVERPDAAFGTDWLGGDRDDWDAVSNDAAADGDTRAWTTLLNLARAGVDTPEALWHLEGKTPEGIRDPSLPVWLDVDPYIDYMLTNLWVGNTDWPHKNWWVGRPRDGSFGFRFFMWDSEWSLGLRSDLGTDRIGVNTGVAIPWAALRNNPEFRHRVADRVHRHFSPGGALYTAPDAPPLDPDDPAAPDLERNIPAARFAALAATVQPALLAESARWGDQHTPAAPYTVAAHWIPERDRLLADYFPHRSARVRQHLRAAGLDAPIPPPDLTPTPEAITLTAEAGVIWYTEDGTDPRLPGGAIAPQALGGDPAHHLAPAPPTLRARALDPRGWSALVEYDLTP